MFNSARPASMTWLGAGKIHEFHPLKMCNLNAVSQQARINTQISRRRRLPVRFGHLGIDTIDLVFNFLANQPNELSNVGAVEIARMWQAHVQLATDAARMRVQDDNAVSQSHRLPYRVRHKQDCL